MSSVKEQRPLARIPTLDELLALSPQLKMEDIRSLQDWMASQPHLPKVPDDMLVPFLHLNRYSLERAKQHIECHYTMRTHCPELFHDRDPMSEAVRKQMMLCQGGHLHSNDPDGNMVWLSRLLPCNASEIDFDVCFKIVMMAVDQTVRQYPLCPGHVLIEDLKEVTMSHIPVIKISTLRKMFKYMQEGMHVDVKALHVLNVSTVVDYLLSFIKPFLHKDMAAKIHLHTGPVEDIHKVIPPAILPKEYGGSLGDMEELHDYTIRTLEHHRDWFVENNYFVDETKRPGRSSSAGSFRSSGSLRKMVE